MKDGHYYTGKFQWSTCGYANNPITYKVDKYIVPTCSSLMRLAISTGLIETRHQGYLFKSGSGMANFVNMHGMAMYGNVSLFLASNDLSMRGWLGWDSVYADTLRGTFYQHITKRASQWLVIWSDMHAVTN